MAFLAGPKCAGLFRGVWQRMTIAMWGECVCIGGGNVTLGQECVWIWGVGVVLLRGPGVCVRAMERVVLV